MDNIRWATPLGQFDCDGFIVNVWRPRRFLRWLFPGYWRFRLPDDLVSMFRVVGAKEALGYILMHWRERSGFTDPHNYTAQEMPPVISLSRDGGDTWVQYGTDRPVCGDVCDVAMSDEHYIAAVPEVE